MMNAVVHVLYPEDSLTEDECAKAYGESVKTVRNRRLRGEGPPYYKTPGRNGRVRYSRKEVGEWYGSFRVVPPLTEMPAEQPPALPPPKRGRGRPRKS